MGMPITGNTIFIFGRDTEGFILIAIWITITYLMIIFLVILQLVAPQPISPRFFSSQFKFDGNFVLLLYLFLFSYLCNIVCMPWKCYCGSDLLTSSRITATPISHVITINCIRTLEISKEKRKCSRIGNMINSASALLHPMGHLPVTLDECCFHWTCNLFTNWDHIQIMWWVEFPLFQFSIPESIPEFKK